MAKYDTILARIISWRGAGEATIQKVTKPTEHTHTSTNLKTDQYDSKFHALIPGFLHFPTHMNT